MICIRMDFAYEVIPQHIKHVLVLLFLIYLQVFGYL